MIVVPGGLAVATHETTFDQWQACVDDGGCTHRPDDHGWGQGRRPVINVSWGDARQYVAWLGRKTGRSYRLPSLQEWAVLARGPDSAPASDRSKAMPVRENCRGCESTWGGRQTAPVGSFPANGFGLFDMLGNVMEWTADCWEQNGPSEETCAARVVGGGSWYYRSAMAAPTAKSRIAPAVRSYSIGFRVVRKMP